MKLNENHNGLQQVRFGNHRQTMRPSSAVRDMHCIRKDNGPMGGSVLAEKCRNTEL
jgi:hypothetical protein